MHEQMDHTEDQRSDRSRHERAHTNTSTHTKEQQGKKGERERGRESSKVQKTTIRE
jgi:hypothetical protein